MAKKMSETAMKEREENIKACCRAEEEKRDMKDIGFISAETVEHLDKNGAIDFTESQRGYVKSAEMITALLNDIIHGILMLLNPIKFFMFVPNGMDFITVNTYISDYQKYHDDGYKLMIADGSQRLRTILGFMRNQLELPKLFGKKNGNFLEVKNVYFNELTKAGQTRIKTQNLFYVCVCSHSEADFNDIFDKNNRLQTNLNVVELMNNRFGRTKLWKRALSALRDKRIIDLLALSDDKSHDMQDKNEAMKKSDRGNAVISLLKILVHMNGKYAKGTVNTMVENMLANKIYQQDEVIDSLFEQLYNIIDICKSFPVEIYGGRKVSVNRVRSIFAAVSIMEKNHKGLMKVNEERIKDVMENIYPYIPSAQDASATEANVNKEIKMYTAMFQYICGIEDRNDLQNAPIDICLRYQLKDGIQIDIKEAIDDYYNKDANKISA